VRPLSSPAEIPPPPVTASGSPPSTLISRNACAACGRTIPGCSANRSRCPPRRHAAGTATAPRAQMTPSAPGCATSAAGPGRIASAPVAAGPLRLRGRTAATARRSAARRHIAGGGSTRPRPDIPLRGIFPEPGLAGCAGRAGCARARAWAVLSLGHKASRAHVSQRVSDTPRHGPLRRGPHQRRVAWR
jgi:hypothetical protein